MWDVDVDQAVRERRDHGAAGELAPAARRRDQGQQPGGSPSGGRYSGTRLAGGP